MSVPLHDHKQKSKIVFCPLMKEVCHDGWTKSMGAADESSGVRPVCVRWRGVFVNDPRATPALQEVFDCVDAWQTDLLQQVAQEIYQGAAATEQVRNHVAGQAHTFKAMGLAFQGMARKSGVTLQDIQEIEKEQQALLEVRNNTEGGKKQ